MSKAGEKCERPALAAIEVERLENIKRNKEILKKLGLDQKPKLQPIQIERKPSRQSYTGNNSRRQSFEPSRRSARLEGKQPAKYHDMDIALESVERRNSWVLRQLDEAGMTAEEVEELRQKSLSMDPDEYYSSGRRSGAIDSGKGRRIINGRLYDSVNGVTCHWCRQKTAEQKITCTNENCRGGSNLRVSYCKKCLRNRNGEDLEQAMASQCWICPCCRVSCGPGCISCCNCSFCREKNGLKCTGQILGRAKRAGFDNVHDFLVHQTTGESPEEIAARKMNFEWGKFLQG